MTVNVVDCIPIGNAQIRQRVVAREMQLALEHLPIRAEALLQKQFVHTPDEQSVEHNNHQQHHTCLYAFFRLQLENLKRIHTRNGL